MVGGQNKRHRGQQGESEAEKFLTTRCRYQVIERNYRSPFGEIDLIALDSRTIVFIEVRSHTGSQFGDPLESVNRRKQWQIAKTALYYLARHRLQDREARFDVVGVRWEEGRAHLAHIKGAFDLPRQF